MSLRKFFALTFLILLIFSMTAIATAQPIDMEYCIDGGPHDVYYYGEIPIQLGGDFYFTWVEIFKCHNCDYEIAIW